jgi:hypothetical protein
MLIIHVARLLGSPHLWQNILLPELLLVMTGDIQDLHTVFKYRFEPFLVSLCVSCGFAI